MTHRTANALAAERADIEAALRNASGRVDLAAMALGMNRATLYRKILRHGLDPASYRPAADGPSKGVAP